MELLEIIWVSLLLVWVVFGFFVFFFFVLFWFLMCVFVLVFLVFFSLSYCITWTPLGFGKFQCVLENITNNPKTLFPST